jgi:hypothetical protein
MASTGTPGSTGSSLDDTGPPPTTTTMPSVDSSGGSLDDTGEPPMGECILYGNDCRNASQKCMPWSLEDDQIPDETRCCALQDNPDLVGEPCTVSDYNGSCVDSCEEGAMCVIDEHEALSGTCRRFCNPGAMGPECTDQQTCKTFFELLPMALNVPMCMERCDPLLQDCVQSGWLCIPDSPTLAGQSGFICVPPPPDPPHTLFQGCGLANECEPGLVCISASRVPDCPGIGCCSAYCSNADGDDPCIMLHPDLRCVDWMSPDPDWTDVGACAIPD